MKFKTICFLILCITIISSCKKKEDESAPRIATSDIQAITSYTARMGGSEIENGPILEKGVCWSNDHIPDITDNHVSAGDGEDNFYATASGLEANMTYYVRAYATNKYRTGYGKTLTFTTANPPPLPTLKTNNPTSVTQSSAVCSAILQSVTSKPITSIGFCWSTTAKPKITNFVKTYTASVFTGYTYSLTLSGLTNNTVYYVRAYATNADGTAYGDEIKFKTTYGSVTDYNGNVYGTVIIGGKEWMTENLRVNRFNDGTSIPFVNNTTSWSSLSTAGYCNYNNASTTLPAYGKLYNWYCVNSTRNIAPLGWHVANSSDWLALENELGSNAAAKMRIVGNDYWYYNTGTNESGFSGTGCGYCDQSQYFRDQTYSAYFWINGSSTSAKSLNYSYTSLNTYYMYATSGLSIRCVKD
ncbi:hypothetical protein CNR22_10480 [Sphingobacteriaceae bacterium]|nr:hypothetical protein CNR22_10480 [Sphingobacteriaceae bacterium]